MGSWSCRDLCTLAVCLLHSFTLPSTIIQRLWCFSGQKAQDRCTSSWPREHQSSSDPCTTLVLTLWLTLKRSWMHVWSCWRGRKQGSFRFQHVYHMLSWEVTHWVTGGFEILKSYLVLDMTMLSAVALGSVILSAPQMPKHDALCHAL